MHFVGFLGLFYSKSASFILVSVKNETAGQDFLLNWQFYKKTIGRYKKTKGINKKTIALLKNEGSYTKFV